jgi:F-type H+-transporting ATPase subunit a
MPEHEPWLTALFNDHLAGIANAARAIVGLPGAERPWSASASMEILVAVLIVLLFCLLRSQLSMDRPGKLQHAFEIIYNFLHAETEEHVGHEGPSTCLCSVRFSYSSCSPTCWE